MINLAKKSKFNKKNIRAMLFCVLVFLMIFFKDASLAFVGGVFFPIWKVANNFNINIKYFDNYFLNQERLAEENKVLKDKIEILERETYGFDIIKEEYQKLSLLHFENINNYKIASVISTPPQTINDKIIINIGRNSMVQEKEEVYYGNIYIGLIEKVLDNYSVVSLSSSPQNVFEVRVGTSSRDLIKVYGSGGGDFEFIVPSEFPITLGEKVYIPSGPIKVLGEVELIEKDPKIAFKKVYLSNPFSTSKIDFVTVRSK